MKVLRCGDQNFWAYYWIAQEHARYSRHEIKYAKFDEVNLDGVDLVYIHSPDISNYHAEHLPMEAKKRGIPVIGAYAGNPYYWSPAEKRTYSHADLIVTISPQTYAFACFHYTNIPVIFMPESVDTDFFLPVGEHSDDRFVIGWAGGAHKKIKRARLLDRLDFPVLKKDDWKLNRVSQNVNLTLDGMREFYSSIDVLIVTSLSECMPRVVLEAMACGLPVISTDVGSVRMLLSGEWIVPKNPDEAVVLGMNKALGILKNDTEARAWLGASNRNHVAWSFSWHFNARLWDEVFDCVKRKDIRSALLAAAKYIDPFSSLFSDLVRRENHEFYQDCPRVRLWTEDIINAA